MATPSDWAIFYSRAGWRSFPVKPGEKSPMYKGWQNDATTDHDQILRYWNGKAGAERNLGLVCGEFFDAWDIEFDHVGALSAHMNRLKVRLPETPMATTGRHGIHILTQPTGFDATRKLYLDDVHIGELKSKGGFILACPSETEDLYRWIALPDRLELAAPPEWMLALLERPVAVRGMFPPRVAAPADVKAVLGRLAGSVAHANEGTRNNYLYWAMRRAIEEGIEADLAEKALTVAGREAGLDEHEVQQSIGSALTAESMAA